MGLSCVTLRKIVRSVTEFLLTVLLWLGLDGWLEGLEGWKNLQRPFLV